MAVNLLPSTIAREFTDLVFLYNLLHGKYNIDPRIIVNLLDRAKSTRQNKEFLKLMIPRVKMNVYKGWYNVRCCYLCNKLPNNIRMIQPNINVSCKIDGTFKNDLRRFLLQFFTENFEIFLPCTWKY